MLFSLGPVVRYELITTSRRRRYYFLRVVYGLFLLGSALDPFHARGRSTIRPEARSTKSRLSPKTHSSSSPERRGWGSCS